MAPAGGAPPPVCSCSITSRQNAAARTPSTTRWSNVTETFPIGANDDLTVADDRPLDDPVEADDRDLGVVDERRDQEPAELACARDRDRRVAELLDAEAAGSRALGEATHVGVQLCDRAPRAASHHRDDEPVVGLHRDTDVDAVEEDDLVVLEPCVQLREAHDRRRDCADRVRARGARRRRR